MSNEIVHNERTAVAQVMTDQPDGPGKRIAKRGELSMIGPLVPGGAEEFRRKLPQFQAEANYWESRVGTVQSLRIFLFDNDTRYCLSLLYDGDFKPYLEDIVQYAGPWLDAMATGVLEGYPGTQSPEMGAWVLKYIHPTDFFYAAHPDVSARDLERMKKVSKAVDDLLDAAG